MREIYLTSYSEAVKDINLKKSGKKTAFKNPTLFVFKICTAPDSTYCDNFGRFHRKKFKKITNYDLNTVKNAYVLAFIILEPKFCTCNHAVSSSIWN